MVQALPSLQVLPSALAGVEQTPVAGAQVPASWQSSIARHTTGLEPTHLPAAHASLLVQAEPSLQVVPSKTGDALHLPVERSHTPTLQASSSWLQLTGVPALQLNVERSHVSTPLQALPSLQSASLAQPHLLGS